MHMRRENNEISRVASVEIKVSDKYSIFVESKSENKFDVRIEDRIMVRFSMIRSFLYIRNALSTVSLEFVKI